MMNFEESKFLIALFIPLMILLFVGFKDDMIGLGPKSKLLIEICTAAGFINLTTNAYFHNF